MINGLKILLVEDEILVAHDIINRLSNIGYSSIELVDSSDEAIKAVDQFEPDVIVMDIDIHGDKNGIETAALIREKVISPIVYLTKHLDDETFAKASETLPDAYLNKPVKELDLSRAIELAVNKFEEGQTVSGGIEFGDSVFIKDKGVFVRIKTNTIVHLRAGGAYCEIITRDQTFTQSKSLAATLRNIDKANPSHRIVQIHRSHAVNLDFIDGLDGSRVIVKGEKIDIGKNYLYEFKAKMNLI